MKDINDTTILSYCNQLSDKKQIELITQFSDLQPDMMISFYHKFIKSKQKHLTLTDWDSFFEKECFQMTQELFWCNLLTLGIVSKVFSFLLKTKVNLFNQKDSLFTLKAFSIASALVHEKHKLNDGIDSLSTK